MTWEKTSACVAYCPKTLSKVYVRDVTAVSPLALLLFGGEVEVSHGSGTVTIDGQITLDGEWGSLDGAHCQSFAYIHIYGATSGGVS